MQESTRNSNRYQPLLATMLMPVLLSCGLAHAETLEVTVRVASPSSGQVGCTLYDFEDGFPMDARKGRAQQWHPPAAEVMCRFEALSSGTYAVAVSHDLNGNKIVDTNFVGMPKEAWGVSRNPRPALRAPKFSEASFKLNADTVTHIRIEVKK
jgi:uncharacterized protein (DUF2141 family)